jgi:hypothetical protein
MAGYTSSESAFVSPEGLAYDVPRGRLYVVDPEADPAGAGYTGAVYRVDVSSGRVDLVSSAIDYFNLRDLVVRADGTLLVVDAYFGEPVLWAVDPDATPTNANYRELSWGDQYEHLIDVDVDGEDRVYVLDKGRFNVTTRTWEVRPRVFRVEEAIADPDRNGVLIHQDDVMDNILSIVAVPALRIDTVEPSLIPPRPVDCGALSLVVTGSGLTPGLTWDLGPDVTIIDARWRPIPGSAPSILLEIQPAPGLEGALTLTATHPFGGQATRPMAVTFQGAAPPAPPRAPCSTRGDADCSGNVDGVDLAILGQSFGKSRCDSVGFVEDADFDDDDEIDGMDLAILATFFGARF